MNTSLHRRRVLSWIGASALAPLVATPVLADDHPPTPPLTEGPFYPTSFPKDTDADLTRIEGRAAVAQGRILDVSGRVVDRSGAPPARAPVESLHSDRHGGIH